MTRYRTSPTPIRTRDDSDTVWLTYRLDTPNDVMNLYSAVAVHIKETETVKLPSGTIDVRVYYRLYWRAPFVQGCYTDENGTELVLVLRKPVTNIGEQELREWVGTYFKELADKQDETEEHLMAWRRPKRLIGSESIKTGSLPPEENLF